jgi:hypothetical protein
MDGVANQLRVRGGFAPNEQVTSPVKIAEAAHKLCRTANKPGTHAATVALKRLLGAQ